MSEAGVGGELSWDCTVQQGKGGKGGWIGRGGEERGGKML
jgi:hypothetical protein